MSRASAQFPAMPSGTRMELAVPVSKPAGGNVRLKVLFVSPFMVKLPVGRSLL